jgi:hypothetical protein
MIGFGMSLVNLLLLHPFIKRIICDQNEGYFLKLFKVDGYDIFKDREIIEPLLSKLQYILSKIPTEFVSIFKDVSDDRDTIRFAIILENIKHYFILFYNFLGNFHFFTVIHIPYDCLWKHVYFILVLIIVEIVSLLLIRLCIL